MGNHPKEAGDGSVGAPTELHVRAVHRTGPNCCTMVRARLSPAAFQCPQRNVEMWVLSGISVTLGQLQANARHHAHHLWRESAPQYAFYIPLCRHPSVCALNRGLGTTSHVAEKANSRVTIPSTLKTNTICPLSSSLIWLLPGLPLCLGLLNKCLFKLGEAMMQHQLPG